MKRRLFLLALLMLVTWLAYAAPASEAGSERLVVSAGAPSLNDAAPAAARANAAPVAAPLSAALQDSCCADPNQTDPHWECFDGACVQVNGCGTNVNCATCGCSSSQEWTCINNGGTWDSYTCTCDYSCDPYGQQEANCYYSGGTWDPYNCICYPPQCNPGPPITTYSYYWDDYYCNGTYWVDCSNVCHHKVRYCQDGSIYSEGDECTNSCVVSDEYCGGGGGGGGGGGDCWDWCWCEDGWCCDWDYCWEEEVDL